MERAGLRTDHPGSAIQEPVPPGSRRSGETGWPAASFARRSTDSPFRRAISRTRVSIPVHAYFPLLTSKVCNRVIYRVYRKIMSTNGYGSKSNHLWNDGKTHLLSWPAHPVMGGLTA